MIQPVDIFPAYADNIIIQVLQLNMESREGDQTDPGAVPPL
jgi:hypothetical protein